MDKITPQGLGSVGTAMRAPTLEEERARMLPLIKDFRKQIDALIQQVQQDVNLPLHFKNFQPRTVNEAYDQVRIHLTDAKMWAGKMLEGLGNEFPPELADKAQ